jgi:hypothetical protein
VQSIQHPLYPFYCEWCPFCLYQEENNERYPWWTCEECAYGQRHGICDQEDSSDWSLITDQFCLLNRKKQLKIGKEFEAELRKIFFDRYDMKYYDWFIQITNDRIEQQLALQSEIEERIVHLSEYQRFTTEIESLDVLCEKMNTAEEDKY